VLSEPGIDFSRIFPLSTLNGVLFSPWQTAYQFSLGMWQNMNMILIRGRKENADHSSLPGGQ
jgi:hypothetical protein